MPPIITLTTDFGLSDPYVAALKGVILSINPKAQIVDLSHHIPPQDIHQAAFFLGLSCRFFPKGTIHVAVVDPGVGTKRAPLLLAGESALFVAPDNGILSYVLGGGVPIRPTLPLFSPFKAPLPRGWKAYVLDQPQFWHHPVSSTFHGRDIFAPVAAHLSKGIKPQQLGSPVKSLTYLNIPRVSKTGNKLKGVVLYIDHFGNLITNIPAQEIKSSGVIISIAGREIHGIKSTYAQSHGLTAIIGSHGNLELSVNKGSAAHLLKVNVGEPVEVSLPPLSSGLKKMQET